MIDANGSVVKNLAEDTPYVLIPEKYRYSESTILKNGKDYVKGGLSYMEQKMNVPNDVIANLEAKADPKIIYVKDGQQRLFKLLHMPISWHI